MSLETITLDGAVYNFDDLTDEAKAECALYQTIQVEANRLSSLLVVYNRAAEATKSSIESLLDGVEPTAFDETNLEEPFSGT